jgi:hypothetical protein
MSGDRGVFFLGLTRRYVVTGLLALFVLLCAAWTRTGNITPSPRKTPQADKSQTGGSLRQRTRSWLSVTHLTRPKFRPTRVAEVHTATDFWRAWSRLRPGDEIDVRGVTFPGEAVFRKQLPGWAEIHFGSRTRFTGTPGENAPAAWVDRCSHIRFYGGNLTNPTGGAGVIISDSSWVTWWNFAIHDTANTALFVRGIDQPNSHLDLRGRISHWGLNLALDPHSEKGTGVHGANLADSPFGVSDSRFAFDLHDGAAGAGVEAGGARSSDFFTRNKLYLRCRNLTKVAVKQTAGNCVQLWGVNVTRNQFRYISATNLTGRPFQTGGMYEGQSLATNRVLYGRATRTNLNPQVGPIHWDRRFGTVFQNVSPTQ